MRFFTNSRRSRLSDKLQSLALFLQFLYIARFLVLLTGVHGTYGLGYLIKATDPLANLANLFVPRLNLYPFIIEPGSAVIILVLPFIFSLLSIVLDLVRLKLKEKRLSVTVANPF